MQHNPSPTQDERAAQEIPLLVLQDVLPQALLALGREQGSSDARAPLGGSMQVERRTSPCGRLAWREERLLWGLLATQRLYDPATAAHELRLSLYASETALALGCPRDEAHLVRQAALVHDIGKFWIPPAILHKPGPLTAEELAIMRAHPTLGGLLLRWAGEAFTVLAELVEAHHERWDGLGYPIGLAGAAIPLGARVLAVVDAFDAMTVARPYQPAIPVAAAFAELLRCAGTCFDPPVVTAFGRALAALSRGRRAKPQHTRSAPHARERKARAG